MLMSSIMRARSALTGRFEDWEVIGGSSLKPKVAGPSMLGIGCPDRHALLLMPFPNAATERTHPEAASSRESGFVLWVETRHSACQRRRHDQPQRKISIPDKAAIQILSRNKATGNDRCSVPSSSP